MITVAVFFLPTFGGGGPTIGRRVRRSNHSGRTAVPRAGRRAYRIGMIATGPSLSTAMDWRDGGRPLGRSGSLLASADGAARTIIPNARPQKIGQAVSRPFI